MLPITRKISNYNHSAPNSIMYIVIHDTGNYNDTAAGNANYFCGGDRQASAHYFVDPTSIYQVVEEYDGAWHVGDGGMAYGIGNHNSIGIEMCKNAGDIAESTVSNTIELVKYLMNKHNLSLDRVVRHYDASKKNCPASFSYNNWARWNDFKSKLSGMGSQPINNTGGEEEMKTYRNGSTPEIVYMDSNYQNKIGSLDPWETCEGFEKDGKVIVYYNASAYRCSRATEKAHPLLQEAHIENMRLQRTFYWETQRKG